SQGDLHLANVFTNDLHTYLNKYQKDYWITPIPLNYFSKQNRGFNQVEVLLKQAEIAYVPFLENIRQEDSQSSKNRFERLKTPQPFQLINMDTFQKSTKNKILIVDDVYRSEEHTSELQSRFDIVCRLLLEKKKSTKIRMLLFCN